MLISGQISARFKLIYTATFTKFKQFFIRKTLFSFFKVSENLLVNDKSQPVFNTTVFSYPNLVSPTHLGNSVLVIPLVNELLGYLYVPFNCYNACAVKELCMDISGGYITK